MQAQMQINHTSMFKPIYQFNQHYSYHQTQFPLVTDNILNTVESSYCYQQNYPSPVFFEGLRCVHSPRLPKSERSVQNNSVSHTLTSKNLRSTGFAELTDEDRNSRVNEWISTITRDSTYPHPLNYQD
ncbi:Uncharacterized protein QTN25_005047 [Entamoeba marina]